ncbi:hypothetical protein Tco_1221224 [Tanacetum coccineum]
MERKCVATKYFWKTHKKVDRVLYGIIPQLAERATDDLIGNNLKPSIVATIIEDRVSFRIHPTTTTSTETISSADLQQKLYLKMKKSLQDQANDPVLWEVLKHKFKKSSTSNTSCRDDDIHSQRHDDHQEDDAPPEGEKRVKRHKDAWVEETVIDKDEVILEDETLELIKKLQNVDKHVPTIFDRARMEATLNDMLSNQFKNAEENSYHLEQATNFMKNQIVWESRQEDIRRPILRPLILFGPQRNPNEPPSYLYNKDLFFLKNGNTKEKKYILLLHKIHRVHDFQLGIESYQVKVNLTAPTLTFPGIKACEPYSIVDKPNTGVIYLNNKDEKRVMYLVKIVKFCDATLEKVLKEVKLKIFQSEPWRNPPLLSELDRDIMRAFKREITKHLRNHEQMRRWESFVNERPILLTMKRL